MPNIGTSGLYFGSKHWTIFEVYVKAKPEAARIPNQDVQFHAMHPWSHCCGRQAFICGLYDPRRHKQSKNGTAFNKLSKRIRPVSRKGTRTKDQIGFNISYFNEV